MSLKLFESLQIKDRSVTFAVNGINKIWANGDLKKFLQGSNGYTRDQTFKVNNASIFILIAHKKFGEHL